MKAKTNKKIKNKKETSQVATEEHDIVNIALEDTPWPKKTIRYKVEETSSESMSRSTNYI
jgi:hypothetical protein